MQRPRPVRPNYMLSRIALVLLAGGANGRLVLPGGARVVVPSFSRFNFKPPPPTPPPPCILSIGDVEYDLTAWAAAHPGGEAVLHKFNGRNATEAFLRAGHSQHAHDMLRDFALPSVTHPDSVSKLTGATGVVTSTTTTLPPLQHRGVSKARKLFTHEDPLNLHKGLGVFVLLHFVYRYALCLLSGDPSAGYGAGRLSRLGGVGLAAHAALSGSSLRFTTVPRARVVGKPMIWQEVSVMRTRAHEHVRSGRPFVS